MPRAQIFNNAICLKLTDEQISYLRHYAYEEEDISMSDVIRALLDEHMAQNKLTASVV